MRNQYKILAEKYQSIHEASNDNDNAKAGIDKLAQAMNDYYVREPVLMTIDLDSGGEFANEMFFTKPLVYYVDNKMFFNKPKELPASAIPALPVSSTVKGLWVDPKQPRPDYSKTFLKIYVTTSAKELVDSIKSEQGMRNDNLYVKYIKPMYDYLSITGGGYPVVPGTNWRYED